MPVSWEGERCVLPSSSLCGACRVWRRLRRGPEKTWHADSCHVKAGPLAPRRLWLNSSLSSMVRGRNSGAENKAAKCVSAEKRGVWRKQPWQLGSVAWRIKGFYMFHSRLCLVWIPGIYISIFGSSVAEVVLISSDFLVIRSCLQWEKELRAPGLGGMDWTAGSVKSLPFLLGSP